MRFWKDEWCGDVALCDSFPSLYALAESKEVWVAEVWDSSSEVGGWNPHFSKPFNDWEVDLVERFLSTIQGKRVFVDLEDRALWKETRSGSFLLSFFMMLWRQGMQPLFCGTSYGIHECLSKWAFFAWEASCGKVLTLDRLKRRGWTLANRCFLCLVEEEYIDHVLIHCSKAKVLWELIFALFGVSWVLPLSVKETLLGWNGSFVGKKHQKAWKAAPLCLFWTVWKERNKIAFENG